MRGLTAIAAATFGWAVLLACGGDEGTEPSPDAARAQKREQDETRALMREIFSGIQVALPASVGPAFREPERRAEIAAALDLVADNASALESHADPGDEQMTFLARSVARDARGVRRAFAEERYNRSAFLLRQITENCVVCHTRLPSLRDSPVARGFVEGEALEQMLLEPRATLQIATRRFDDGLATLETLLASPGEHPAVLLGPLTDYLVVCLRVKGDYERALATLQRFRERSDLWEELRGEVDRWIAALGELRDTAGAEAELSTAREILERSDPLHQPPENREALVELVVASSILQRYIAGHSARDRDLAEAYYLLGIIEARIGRNYWVTPAPFLLERAIRLAPGEPFAREAYALLESETLGNYEGSDFEELPDEDERHLKELRTLIEAG